MQSLFLLSSSGEVLIERHFRGTTSRSVCDYFWERASCSDHMGGGGGGDAILPPVLEVPAESGDSEKHGGGGGGTLYLFHIWRDDLTFLAVCPAEVSPLLVIEFLHRVADIFVDYFGSPADESAIKDNFSTVYQLLEEMVDYGWPLTTEPNALKAMIRPPTVMGKVRCNI
jgi:AP-3 complex subunit mu